MQEDVPTTVDLDVDGLNLEHRRLVLRVLAREDDRCVHDDALTADEDVSEALVLHLGQTSLLAVERRRRTC